MFMRTTTKRSYSFRKALGLFRKMATQTKPKSRTFGIKTVKLIWRVGHSILARNTSDILAFNYINVFFCF